MPNMLPPVKGASFAFDLGLVSQSDTDILISTASISSGDVLVSKDGAAASNIAGLPTEIGTSGIISASLSSTEMNADRVAVLFHDVTGSQWQDALVTIYTSGQTFNSMQSSITASGPVATTATDGSATPTVASGTYLNTNAQNSVYWQITASAAAVITATLTYACGTGTLANTVRVVGRYQVAAPTAGKYVNVQAYNYKTAVWDTISSSTSRMNGQTGTTDNTYTYPLTVDHLSAAGAAQIKFVGSDMTATSNLYLDYVPYLYQTTGATVDATAQAVYLKMKNTVYENGVWIDTTNGTAGTVIGDNGTAWNPCLTYADALTIAAALGVQRFYLKPTASITLTQSHAGWRFIGHGTIALGSQSIADAVFENCASITGLSTGDDAEFINCGIGTCTLYAAHFIGCYFTGTLTLISANDYHFQSCVDSVADGTATMVFAASTNAYLRDWRGGVQVNSLGSSSECIIDGAGRVIIDATSTGGAITLRGHFPLATGAATFIAAGGSLTDDQSYSESVLVTSTGTGVASSVWTAASATYAATGNMAQMLNTRTTLGAGAASNVYTVTDGSGTAIPDVDVWATSDVNGANIVASGRTDSSGHVTFWLDTGLTYYVWKSKSGYNFGTQPDTEVAV